MPGSAMEATTIAASDGSGGHHSSDHRLRRCGWGAAIVHRATLRVLGQAWGPLEGPRQSVPRAELAGAAW
eukprot:9655427-Lingulodinium_polyedra.AAC.1